ncbi:MAG: hypothetical protein NZ455_13620 [Bacteroidia bacterium]|nr:hypothetical protein [Bacteroidia bacterium]MDW8347079.1 hypothetical protein [Bacteroidia bacterium]
MIINVKQGKAKICIKPGKTSKYSCVRDTKHAVKQCEALAQHRSDSVVRSSPTRAQRGTRPKK